MRTRHTSKTLRTLIALLALTLLAAGCATGADSAEDLRPITGPYQEPIPSLRQADEGSQRAPDRKTDRKGAEVGVEADITRVDPPNRAPVDLLEPATVEIRQRTISEIQFDFDSSQLGPDAERQLEGALAWLKTHPQRGLVIQGHASQQGPRDHNMQLAHERARAVSRHLISQGVSPERLAIATRGEQAPAVYSDDAQAHAQNRRVTLETDPANPYGVNHGEAMDPSG